MHAMCLHQWLPSKLHLLQHLLKGDLVAVPCIHVVLILIVQFIVNLSEKYVKENVVS